MLPYQHLFVPTRHKGRYKNSIKKVPFKSGKKSVITEADAICAVTPCKMICRSIVPLLGRSSIDGVGVNLSSEKSESASKSFRTLSSDGIISTCGMEYSLSSNWKLTRKQNSSMKISRNHAKFYNEYLIDI